MTTTSTTPKKGDLLYRISWNGLGEIEIVTFLEENIAEGASIPTWIVRKLSDSWNNLRPRTRVGVDAYHLTAQAAWQAYQEDVRLAIPSFEQAVEKEKQELEECRKRLRNVEGVLLRNDWPGKP